MLSTFLLPWLRDLARGDTVRARRAVAERTRQAIEALSPLDPAPLDYVPRIERLDERFAEAVIALARKEGAAADRARDRGLAPFRMGAWHDGVSGLSAASQALDPMLIASCEEDCGPSCGTSHCLAGWAIQLGGVNGYALELAVGAEHAGEWLFRAAYPGRPVPPFYGDDADALVCFAAVAGRPELFGAVAEALDLTFDPERYAAARAFYYGEGVDDEETLPGVYSVVCSLGHTTRIRIELLEEDLARYSSARAGTAVGVERQPAAEETCREGGHGGWCGAPLVSRQLLALDPAGSARMVPAGRLLAGPFPRPAASVRREARMARIAIDVGFVLLAGDEDADAIIRDHGSDVRQWPPLPPVEDDEDEDEDEDDRW